jgi:hypothetical protein
MKRCNINTTSEYKAKTKSTYVCKQNTNAKFMPAHCACLEAHAIQALRSSVYIPRRPHFACAPKLAIRTPNPIYIYICIHTYIFYTYIYICIHTYIFYTYKYIPTCAPGQFIIHQISYKRYHIAHLS